MDCLSAAKRLSDSLNECTPPERSVVVCVCPVVLTEIVSGVPAMPPCRS